MSTYTIATPVKFSFGSFEYFCSQIALPVCSLVGTQAAKEPKCYARNIDIDGFLIFEPATLAIHVVALIMTIIMISNVRFKYTSVGRKEIMMFFYMYAMSIIAEFLAISGIVPFSSDTYRYFVALSSSVNLATLWCLFMNGFVPFQFIEDGTAMSMWIMRISTFIVFAGAYFINIATFESIAGLTSASPGALWTINFIFGGAFVIFYFGFQLFLVFTQMDDRILAVDIILAAVFFILSQIVSFVLSPEICEAVKHYIDGMFFSTILNLLSVMMIYKFWDNITKEDLEFAVGCKTNSWEIRDPLLSDAAMAAMTKGVEDNYGATRVQTIS